MKEKRKFQNGDRVILDSDQSPIVGEVCAGYWSEATNRWLYSVKWRIMENCMIGKKGEVFSNMRDERDLRKHHKLSDSNPNVCFKMLKGGAYGHNQKAKTP
jgi:hypothetical protein